MVVQVDIKCYLTCLSRCNQGPLGGPSGTAASTCTGNSRPSHKHKALRCEGVMTLPTTAKPTQAAVHVLSCSLAIPEKLPPDSTDLHQLQQELRRLNLIWIPNSGCQNLRSLRELPRVCCIRSDRPQVALSELCRQTTIEIRLKPPSIYPVLQDDVKQNTNPGYRNTKVAM